MSMAVRSAFLSLVACLAAPVAWAAGPPTGVYSCYDARMDYKMQLAITPMPFVMFGIIDAAPTPITTGITVTIVTTRARECLR